MTTKVMVGSEIGHFDKKKMVVWTILVQHTFRQHRGHALEEQKQTNKFAPTPKEALVGTKPTRTRTPSTGTAIETSQRVKTQRAKTSENFAEGKMFARDISEDFSEDRRYHFYWILKYFWLSSKSSRKIAFFWEAFGSLHPLGSYP